MNGRGVTRGRLVSGIAALVLGCGLLSGGPSYGAERKGKDPELIKIIKGMTLEQKVGQLFVTHAYGDRADTTDAADVAANRAAYGVDNAEQLIKKYHLGGIIYFAWSNNTKTPAQIAGLSDGIQKARPGGIPLMITTDQEGGLVVRVGPPATQFPGNMALGAARRPQGAFTAARIGGTELRAMGINTNYAPVADVNVNPANPVIGVRSYGSDPGMAATMTAAQVRGYQSANVAATAKHFPGHGDTNVDSHTGVPVINHSREEWQRLDMPPFRAAIASGINAIMTAHIVVPALDPSGDPATLSKPIMTGILREELRYDGVVVTDALGMKGVRDKYGDDRVPVLALKAGVDQLLKPPDGVLDLQYNAVLKAVRSGELTEQRIDESVYRVLRLKKQRGLFRDASSGDVAKVVGKPEHLARAQKLTDPTTTLIKNEQNLLPIAADRKKILVAGWGVTKPLSEAMTKRGREATALDTGSTPSQATIDAAVARAAEHDLTVVTTHRAWATPQQAKLVKALVASGKPVVAVSVRDPYDIGHFTEAKAFVTTFSATTPALESLTKVLLGERRPQGKLPVPVPGLYPYGHGLSY